MSVAVLDDLLWVHALWDELADFDASRCDEAMTHLMRCLCDRFDAHNAVWVGALRLDEDRPDDPTNGWRAAIFRYLDTTTAVLAVGQELAAKLRQGVADITVVRNLEGAGSFRANRLRDLIGPDWFSQPYFNDYFRPLGLVDSMWTAFPLNPSAESWFGFYRRTGQEPFSETERDRMAYALRGIKWFHRQLMLSHGLLLAASPLTPTERKVLHLILTGLPEKQIADQLARSQHTVHETVTSIYRKFGVTNRASLMAIWLGRLN